MAKAGAILIYIMFIIQSILIIPLIWTIPGFKLYGKINRKEANENQIVIFAILGIIFGGVLGIIGGILVLIDKNSIENKQQS